MNRIILVPISWTIQETAVKQKKKKRASQEKFDTDWQDWQKKLEKTQGFDTGVTNVIKIIKILLQYTIKLGHKKRKQEYNHRPYGVQ